MERLGMKVEFVDGLRVSDADTVEVAKMVLIGKENKDIVGSLNRHGQPAVGLSGDDGGLFHIRKQPVPEGARDLGFVGQIERVDVDLLERVAENYIPVIASVGADDEGHSYNVNADDAARAVARALRAYKLIFLTDTPGWLADVNDPESKISQAKPVDVLARLESITGGMRPKLAACVDAVQGGVGAAQIVDGRVPHSLLLELFTIEGSGTKIFEGADPL
jgi:acetylglutamate kinase